MCSIPLGARSISIPFLLDFLDFLISTSQCICSYPVVLVYRHITWSNTFMVTIVYQGILLLTHENGSCAACKCRVMEGQKCAHISSFLRVRDYAIMPLRFLLGRCQDSIYHVLAVFEFLEGDALCRTRIESKGSVLAISPCLPSNIDHQVFERSVGSVRLEFQHPEAKSEVGRRRCR